MIIKQPQCSWIREQYKILKHIIIFRYSSLPILGLLRIERELQTLNLSKLGSETRVVSRPSQDIYCKLKSQTDPSLAMKPE